MANPPPRVLVDYPWVEVDWGLYSGFWQMQSHSFDNHVRALHFIQRCISIDGPRVTKCPAQTKLLHGSAGKPKRDAAAAASSSATTVGGSFRFSMSSLGSKAGTDGTPEASPASSGAGHRPSSCRPPQAHSTAIQLITTGDQTHARSCLRDWHATYVGTSGCQKGTFVLTSQFENLGNICAFFKVVVALHPDNIAHPGHYPLYVERPSPRSKKADKTPYEPLWLPIDAETMIGNRQECDRAYEAFYETAIRRPIPPADSSPAAAAAAAASASPGPKPSINGRPGQPSLSPDSPLAGVLPEGSRAGTGRFDGDSASSSWLKPLRDEAVAAGAHSASGSPSSPVKAGKRSKSRRKHSDGAHSTVSAAKSTRYISAPQKTPQSRTGTVRPSKAKARTKHQHSGAKPKIKRVQSSGAALAGSGDAQRPRFGHVGGSNARARVHAASPELSIAPAPSPLVRGPPGGFNTLEGMAIRSPTLHGVARPFTHQSLSGTPAAAGGAAAPAPCHLSAMRRNSLPSLTYSIGPPGGPAGQTSGRPGYLVGLQSPRAPAPPGLGRRCAPLCVSAPESPSLVGQSNPMSLTTLSGSFMSGLLPFSPSPRSNVFPSIAPPGARSALSVAPHSAMNRSKLEGLRLLATAAASHYYPPGSCSGSPSINSAMSTPALGSPLTSPPPAASITPPTPTQRLQVTTSLPNVLPPKGGPLKILNGMNPAPLSGPGCAAVAAGVEVGGPGSAAAGGGFKSPRLLSPHPRFDELIAQARRLLPTSSLTQVSDPSDLQPGS